jgi:KUP system potassium uptake protein
VTRRDGDGEAESSESAPADPAPDGEQSSAEPRPAGEPARSQPDPAPEPAPEPVPEPDPVPEPEPVAAKPQSEPEPETEAATETETESVAETATETESETVAETATEPESESVAETATETESETVAETATEPESESVAETATETESETVAETATEPESASVAETATETESETVAETATATESETETVAETPPAEPAPVTRAPKSSAAKPSVVPRSLSARHAIHGGHSTGLGALCLTALGVVYGDIGTSPLYALRECFHGDHAVTPTPANVLGVLSMIFWALVVVVTLKYLAYVLRADNRGEGGELSLMALALGSVKSKLIARVVVILGIFGAALLYGDGMITPAISVLSAVEGLKVAQPELEHFVVPITIGILVLFFLFQKKGTARVGTVFGPVMILWFLVLAVIGVSHIIEYPDVFWAVDPRHGAYFMIHNKWKGFLVLGAVFLVVTGGEALYADMGHFGIKPIRITWLFFVAPSLVLTYFGQGALLLQDPSVAVNPFYKAAPTWALYPLLTLATMAAIIASQAVVSGAFSYTRQGMMLGFWPRLDIRHTSATHIGQIYVPFVNWALMAACIGLVLGFGSSSRLAAAYGIAVTTTMVITTLLAFVVARYRWGWSLIAAASLTLLFLVADLGFFGANLTKVAHGGWFPLVIAGFIFLLMTTWKRGRDLMGEKFRSQMVPLNDFYELILIERPARVPGTAVFMTSNTEGTPPALMQNFLHNRVVHKHVILLTIITTEQPRVMPDERVRVEDLPEGFTRVVARFGFMESPDIPQLLDDCELPNWSIEHTTFFLGRETVLAQGREGMARWRESIFSFMGRNSQRAPAFFNIPSDRVMEIGSQISL